ncbi:hypothetical protein AVEN_37351-1 [Araneus ventricosus]|uniref:Tc3 transposase DNA binding domain-containing protein n=2 Tax=Araneus ventricosus TaxID=182803 RepID=A0A4Y2BCZ9_ARAVE|nr:hypothetical protein AVEN_37351-1 [Araneus ventricosus]
MSHKCIRSVPASAMACFQDLSDFERGVIVGAREMGHSISEVAMKFGFSRTTISRVYREYRVSDWNNATPHASRVATKWLQEHSSDFRHFHWPPKSPERNINEDIRDALLHAVEKRYPPPRTPMDLLTALQDSWCEFPPGYLQTPVESMPCRFASLLCARGGPTRY